MKTLKLLMLSMVAMSLVFTGCSKEAATPTDMRDQAVGSYNYKRAISANGRVTEDIGTLQVKKSTANSSTIEIVLSGTDVLMGEKVEVASNGFSFDVRQQKFGDIDVKGRNGIEVAGTMYHGGFFSPNKKIQIYLDFTTSTGDQGIITIEGTKI